MGIVKAKTITPLQAIRKHCLQCSCGDKNEVDNCVIQGCPLYNFRFGEKGKSETEECDNHVGDILDKKGAKVVEKPHVTIEMEETEETKILMVKDSDKVKEPDEIIEPISKVDTGTGTICGEKRIVGETVEVEESKPPIEDGHKFVVDLDKVERKDEDKPVKKSRAKKVKKETAPVVEEKKEEQKPVDKKKTEKKEEQNLDDLDLDDLFD